MKNKLRKIVVENENYLWRRQHFHVNKDKKENICVEKITIYLNGYKKSPLNIYFENTKQKMAIFLFRCRNWFLGRKRIYR